MKLVVQIPCLNEAATLADVVRSIPSSIEGIDVIETLVVDDGSTDDTAVVAHQLGVHHVVRHTSNRGLAAAFRTGLDASLSCGADIIVNTDADNQYDSRDIAALIKPIIDGVADIVIGDRQTRTLTHFSLGKRALQSIGSGLVRQLSGTAVNDAVSGFRAISRHAALKLNIVSDFSYTIEMLIQAGSKDLSITSVPVRVNPPTRPSRLFRSVRHFITRSATTMVRMFAMYRPLLIFASIGGLLSCVGLVPILRFLYFWLDGRSAGHIQSLVLGGVLVILGFGTLMLALVADLINFNRHLIEQTLEKVRRLELDRNDEPSRK